MRLSVPSALAVIVTTLILGAGPAAAQHTSNPSTARGPMAEAAATIPTPLQNVVKGAPSGRKGALIGALIGSAGAAAITYWAAKNYGENPPGGFCGGCFTQWGAIAIPVGALIGGVVGHLVSLNVGPLPDVVPRRQPFVAPLVGRRSGGVVLSVTY